jgi:hypothetical protein
MTDQEGTDRQIKAFRRFLTLLPHGKDRRLVLLQAHLLIEEQLRQLVSERLKNTRAIDEADLTFHQCACIAQSFFPPDHLPWLWAGVTKLNKIRNKAAHKLEPKGLQQRMDDLVNSVPSGFNALDDEKSRFELTLWSLFTAVSDLVKTPSAKVIRIRR